MPFTPGARLDGRYEIQKLLGTGGMGEVYQARDLRLGREVAIKVLPRHLSEDPEALGRFEWEARVLASLSHPNLRGLHDLGQTEEVHFAVMELLEGETLRRRMEGGPLPLPEALQVACLLAEGLCAAHAKGIIHRDLKPENIFFTTDGQVKILDFGLARLAPGAGAAQLDSRQAVDTQPGLVLGTAGYMAPEQIRGQALDGRSDLFALGCVLYEMLEGRRPFQGGTFAETLASILRDPLPPPRGPLELRRFLARCLEKDPLNRIGSAREALLGLRELAARVSGELLSSHVAALPSLAGPAAQVDLPTQALPARAEGRLPALKRPGLLTRLLQAWPFRSRKVQDLAVLPFEIAGRDPDLEYLAEGLAEGLIERLSWVQGLRVAPWSAVRPFRDGDLDLRDLGAHLGVQAVLTGRLTLRGEDLSVSAELLDVRSLSHLWGERYDRQASALMEVQRELCARIADQLQVQVTGAVKARLEAPPSEDSEAFNLYLKGRHAWRARSAEGLQRAVGLFQAALERDPRFALAYAGLADAYTLLSFLVGVIAPVQAMPLARAAAEQALRLRPDLAEAHASLAMILETHDWDWPAAEAAHRRAVTLDPANPNLHHRYGMHLLYRGRFAEAADRFREAGRLDPLSPLFQVAKGLPAHFGRRPGEAAAAFRHATTLAPHFLIGHVMLGLAFVQGRQQDQAVDAFQRALALAEAPDTLAMLGHALALGGRAEEARAVLDRLRELSATRYVNAYGPALIHLALGGRENALDLLEQAVASRCELLVYLGIDPRLDPLRQEPRFQALAAKVGLG